MSRALAARSAVLVLYAAVLVGLTWPLAAVLGSNIPFTGMPSRYDLPYMAYILAHETRALTTAPSRFLDPGFFHPAQHTLFYGDTGFGALPLFLPTFLATGNPTLAINLVFLLGLTLTAWALHLVVHRWTGSHLAGVVAAGTFLSNRLILWDLPSTAPTYGLLLYFPLIIAAAVTPAASWRDTARLVPLVFLQCLSDVVYLASAVFAPLGVLAVARLFRSSTRAAGARLLAGLVVVVVLLLPVYAGHLAAMRGGGLDTVWHPILVPPTLPWGPFHRGPFAIPLVAWVVIGVGAAVAFRSRSPREPWLHAALWAVVAFFVALPPVAMWSGQFIELPIYRPVRRLGVYQLIRSPPRLGLAGLMGLALLAGLGFAECVRRLPAVARVGAAVAVLGLLLMDYVGTVPFGLGEYPLLPAVARDEPLSRHLALPGGPVVELPLGGRGTGRPALQADAMYRSIFHGRPLLNGYDSYWPPGFAERMDLVAQLPDAGALAALRRETGLTTIVVHADRFGLEKRESCFFMNKRHETSPDCDANAGAAERAPWLALKQAPRADLRLMWEHRGDMVFEVPPAAEPQSGH